MLLCTAIGLLSSLSRSYWHAHLAESQAQEALRELLTTEEYVDMRRTGYLEIASPSIAERSYRIPVRGGRVQVYEDGHPVCSLCVQLTRSFPPSDVLLAHKLLLESDEDGYLTTANRFTRQDVPPTYLAVPWL